jgi:hypothetical protein
MAVLFLAGNLALGQPHVGDVGLTAFSASRFTLMTPGGA